jgi:outer membrane protein
MSAFLNKNQFKKNVNLIKKSVILSEAARECGGVEGSAVASQPRGMTVSEGVQLNALKGHGFSRAVESTKWIRALAPEGCLVHLFAPFTLMALSCFGTALFAQQRLFPNAPAPQLIAQASQPPSDSQPPNNAQSSTVPAGPKLTLADAERIAIQHNPNVTIAHLVQLAQAQVVREVRSAELPGAIANLTAVDAHNNTRITAGALNNPIVYSRAAGGLTVDQLITDFGRTHNLVKSAQSSTKAQIENERATVDDITLAVDQAFYQALSAQSVLKVAQQTVATRRATGEQIGALTQSKLRSTLDLSLADVQVSQAELLVLDAQNALASAMANLNAILGSETDTQYELVDDTPASPQTAPANIDDLVQLAFRSRPDLAALDDRSLAARQFSAAEHDLIHPTISALAVTGGTPVRADQIASSWYGAAGANISIPLFNGFEYSARAKEADLRAGAAREQVRNLRDTIARDVRSAVLNAQIAFQRIAVTQQLLNQANTALELAQARYKVGLAGIVDLTQSQLAQTEAEIGFANAGYTYQTALAVVRYQTGQ